VQTGSKNTRLVDSSNLANLTFSFISALYSVWIHEPARTQYSFMRRL